MKPRLQRAAFAGLSVLAVCGCSFTLLGQYVVDRDSRGGNVSWKRVPDPPGQPARLRLGEEGEVLVETADGRFLEWDRHKETPWVEVEEPSGRAPWWGACRSDPESDLLVAELPPGVVQRIAATCPGPETGAHYEFVLLENGEIWMWQFSTGSNVVPRALALVGGCGLSLLLGAAAFVLAGLDWRRH